MGSIKVIQSEVGAGLAVLCLFIVLLGACSDKTKELCNNLNSNPKSVKLTGTNGINGQPVSSKLVQSAWNRDCPDITFEALTFPAAPQSCLDSGCSCAVGNFSLQVNGDGGESCLSQLNVTCPNMDPLTCGVGFANDITNGSITCRRMTGASTFCDYSGAALRQ